MADKLFNEQMSSSEARSALFKAVESKTKEEIEKIKEEYCAVLSVIHEREFRLASEGWFVD